MQVIDEALRMFSVALKHHGEPEPLAAFEAQLLPRMGGNVRQLVMLTDQVREDLGLV